MNPEHLKTLLAAGSMENPERSPDCPDEHQIAGYVDGTLDPAACEALERHAADCSYCLSLVGLLSREHEAGANLLQTPEIPATAGATVHREQHRRWQRASRWAIAASVVLAVPLLLQLGRGPERGVEATVPTDRPSTRTAGPMSTGLQVLSPDPGAALDPRELSFRWSEVAGTPYYDVRIVTDAGDIVAQERVDGTNWQPEARLDLQPGAEYFVLVDAYPEGDKAVSSRHVPFRITD